jgi:FkbM family methyltransferase
MIQDLIYDVGMADGRDTAYYLSRGFRVVAVEASPQLASEARLYFEAQRQAGQLIILENAIAVADGALPFWIFEGYPEWNSFDPGRAEQAGIAHYKVAVSCRTFDSILREYGVPYYLKIDIEGADYLCIEALTANDLPAYLSFEKNESWPESLAHLHDLGYTRFKCIGQKHFRPLEMERDREQRKMEIIQRIYTSTSGESVFARLLRRAGLRDMAKEGFSRSRQIAGVVFPHGSSGPFGEDTRGRWQSYAEMVKTLGYFDARFGRGQRSAFWGHTDKAWSFWADIHAAI